jgi:hypothetical protein
MANANTTGNQFSYYPPNGLDRADGLENRPGTITSIGQFMINSSQGGVGGYYLEEESDSPEIERAEQGTIVHKFKCDPLTAKVLITTIGRGYTFEDSNGYTSRCVSSRLVYNKGLVCGVHITCESLNWDWPPDEFSLDITELNPALAKHPRYGLLTYQQRQLVNGSIQAESPEFAEMYQSIIDNIPNDPTYGVTPRQQAQELAFKLHKGEDSFYLPGFRITFSQYYSIPVPLSGGGFIQDPITSGILPYYFWNTSVPPDQNQANSIFSNMITENPTIYANGISWLRLADSISYQRTWYRVTKQWQGAPLGQWDKELYTATPQPYQTSETQGSVLRP